MKRLFAQSALALALLCGAPWTFAQTSPPALPALTQQQSTDLRQRVDAYRYETDARVARGEITADEAERLVGWREWQLAQQMTGNAGSPPMVYDSAPPDYYASRPRDYAVVAPPPYYDPYYRYPPPYYWAPRPYYYWGPSVCAGGFGRHFGGRICF